MFVKSSLIVAFLLLSATPMAAEDFHEDEASFESLAVDIAPAPDDLSAEATMEVTPSEESIPSGRHVVTSLQKCLDSLDPADASEIRRNFVKPYEECLRRKSIADKKAASQDGIPDGKAPDGKPLTPQNYIRIAKPPVVKAADGAKETEKKQ